jgi:excinuclease ABC subunit A
MRSTHLVGARTHNLRNLSLDLHPGELVVLTGVSGAGKSSLALDTLYAEGQRRYIESFSPYARQFLERLERPPVDVLDPVPAGVAVDRRAPVKSSRSTVATMADLEPYLSALFTREALPVCPDCHVTAQWTDPPSAARRAAEALPKGRALVTYPARVTGTLDYLELRDRLAREGYRRLRVGGEVRDIDEVKPSDVNVGGGRLEVVVDRIDTGAGDLKRLAAAIEEAWRQGGGLAQVVSLAGGEAKAARGLTCGGCGRGFEPARPSLFSYQTPVGACPQCRGFGRTIGIDWAKVIPDEGLSLRRGAIRAWAGASTTDERALLRTFCEKKKIPLDVPWRDLKPEQREAVLAGEGAWGGGKFPGVRAWFQWLETRTYKMHVRVFLARYRAYEVCPGCHGRRLNAEALAYRVLEKNLAEWHELEVRDARDALAELKATTAQGDLVRRELFGRLDYLVRVGLGYLTLDRQARTLSGGEGQRVSLTAALGTALTGALFVLDEPTVGLHPSDVEPLVATMRDLARLGNTVVVIEHDPAVVMAADRAIELGPGAGAAGGNLLFDGRPADLARRTDLPTGRVLAGMGAQKTARRKPTGWLAIKNAREHNLQGVDVRLPLGVLCAVTGPSGSGKSTLARDIVYRAAARSCGSFDVDLPGAHDAIDGLKALSSAVLVDQSPLGRTSRGNPATYTKAWDRFRALFAAEPAAARAKLTPAHFSFNVAGGRCEACSGEGSETVEMQFLADVTLVCPSCQGRRFQEPVLAVRHRGLNVAELLATTVDEVLDRFASDPAVVRALRPLKALGLGYLPLGQPLNTLSGGEAQRLKVARALSEPSAGTLFVLDEPSAGLHGADVEYVVSALKELVAAGASALVVEHDTALVEASDWVVDLGPGAGRFGGRVVDQGTPDDLAARGTGRTADALRRAREGAPAAAGETATKAARPKKAAGEAAPAAAAPKAKGKANGKANGQANGQANGHGNGQTNGRAGGEAPPLLRVENAREHNLHGVSCELPLGRLICVTGPSGSGKSTLAFDVIFAEGQRRFLETLSPYARQFLPMMPRADVDRVTGVPPSIALEQRTSRAGANSTVATVTEVAHYLRLLYAKVGQVHCPNCDRPVSSQSPDEIFRQLREIKGPATLYAPAVRARKGTYLDVFTAAARAGFAEAICDGERVRTDAPPKLKKTLEHTIDIVISERAPLAALERPAFDKALELGQGALKLAAKAGAEPRLFSTERACVACGTGVSEIDPRWFSFNTKQGQCPACEGTGVDGGPEAAAGGSTKPCRACGGSRLAPLPRGVRLFGTRYHELMAEPVSSARRRVAGWRFDAAQKPLAEGSHAELGRRLSFLEDVGLGYLSLGRRAVTLSGGEMQRLRLSAQLGSGLTGALYVLDEPTIGLHPRDTRRLLGNLRALVDTGSTVLVVEHDADTIRAADHLIDLGPSGGRRGGRIVAEGGPAKVLAAADSPTARALSAPFAPPRPPRGKPPGMLTLTDVREHNLKNVTLSVPLSRWTVVAGVSGSGKSTLIRQVLLPAVRKKLDLTADPPGAFGKLTGYEPIKRALAVDQSPIGRTPRSVPATFLGIWDEIRKLYAQSPDAQVRGFGPSRFSFNTATGGRCPVCDGQGAVTHEMAFLPDVVTPCEACNGLRFEPATLDVTYLGRSVGEVLRMTAVEAAEHFHAHPKIARPLHTLDELGIGYLQLGQGSNTLSGGEAQRLKLAAELTAGSRHEPTLYVLDEPTTGLHLGDVARLVEMLAKLVDRGDTLVVIEHHPWVIAAADHLVELGPEGGEGGGEIVATGTPQQVARKKTATAPIVREMLAEAG